MTYPTDLTDQQYAKIDKFLPDYKGHCRPRIYSKRSVIDGIQYIQKTGCQWRMLPKEYPPWSTVYHYYRKWRIEGKWDEIHDGLRKEVRESVGKKEKPKVAIIDSRTVKTAQKGGRKDMMEGKRSKDESSILQSILLV